MLLTGGRSSNVTFSTQFQPLLLDANVLFALDDHGIRDKVTPLLGFEYSF